MSNQYKFVYLHGFASGPSSYKATFFAEKLSINFQTKLYCPDLNLPDFFNLTLTSQINFLENQFEKDSVVLIGSSLGAYIALLVAQRNRIKVHALILIAPAFEIVERKVKLMNSDELVKWEKENEIEIFHHFHQQTMKLSFNFIKDAKKYSIDINKLHIPILLFHGKNDDVVDYRLSEKYMSSYPNLEAYFPDSDHLMIDQLDFIWQKAKRFINKL